MEERYPQTAFRNIALLVMCAFVVLGTAGWRIYTVIAEEAAPAPVVVDEDLSAATQEEINRLNDALAKKKQTITQLQQRIGSVQGKIETRRNQAVSLENQLGLIENRLAKSELDIEETNAEIEKTNLEIAALDLRINEKTTTIDQKKKYLAEFVRSIARQSDRTALEVLLAQDSFSDFYDELKTMEDVSSDMQHALADVVTLKNTFVAQQNEKEEQNKRLGELKGKLEMTRASLGEEQSAKSTLASSLSMETLALSQDLSSLKSQQSSIDNDLVTLENALRKKLEAQSSIRKRGEDDGAFALSWPVSPSRGITTYFHDPDYPFRYVFEHPGLDIRAAQGTPIKAPAPGFVARAKDAGMGYSYIMIIHDNGISTVFGHVSRISVKENQFVERGDVIGLSGATPGTPGAGSLTTGPHLHYEVRLNGIPVNPLDYHN